MKNKKKKEDEPILHDDHFLRTRRDFLGAGLLGMSTYTFLPGVLSLFQSNNVFAQAASCNVQQAVVQKTPVIIFDLSGGANLPGSNVMVGGAGGQNDYLASYETLGLPSGMHPSLQGQLNTELGLAFHGDSAIQRGIFSQINAAIRAKVDGAIFCGQSDDDTGNNPHNPAYWLNRAGAKGGLAQLVGTRNSDSGGRSQAPMSSIDPTIKPVQITRPSDALGLVNIGKLGENFSEAKAQRILKAIERMSEQKINAFSRRSLPDQIKTLIKCGYVGSQDLIGKYTSDALDPAQDPMVTAAFNNLSDGDQRKTATIAKLVLDGHVGAGTIEKGGYDYHNKTRATGEVRDEAAGALMGRIIQLAALKQKDVLIYVLTDGGVSGGSEIDNSTDGRGKLVWTGDSGRRSSTFMLLYRHAGRASLRNGVRQLGHFKANGSIEGSATPFSNSVNNLAKVMVANYLALHGEEGNLGAVVGDNPFGNSLSNYLIFNKIN